MNTNKHSHIIWFNSFEYILFYQPESTILMKYQRRVDMWILDDYRHLLVIFLWIWLLLKNKCHSCPQKSHIHRHIRLQYHRWWSHITLLVIHYPFCPRLFIVFSHSHPYGESKSNRNSITKHSSLYFNWSLKQIINSIE